MQESCFALIDTVAGKTKDFVVIFQGEELCFSNVAFNSFFGVSSPKAFHAQYGSIVDRFVPHPSYFNAQKIAQGQSWIEAICKLEEVDRVVSFLSQTHDPHAFSVTISDSVEDYKVITFKDITQSLIKRILIENKMNLDPASGAYTKQYFSHVKQSIEDAARFNEKLVVLTRIEVQEKEEDFIPSEFVATLKKYTREDDMIVLFESGKFLLAYLVDDAQKAEAVEEKLRRVLEKNSPSHLRCDLSSTLQQEGESIAKMLRRCID